MSHRVLFVDDEVSLLNGIKRRLGTTFELVTACSGEEGLTALMEQGPFALVVTDMRMPKMDGVQFIKAARAKAPDTVFIMLTGNQDQATAIQALNDGNVFRFLTKPCQSADIQAAVEAGIRQYQLVTAEKELLHKTFLGAVSVLTDVLELAQPGNFGRTARVQEIVDVLKERLRLEAHWEYALAAKLSMLGFTLLPEQQRTHFEMGVDARDQLRATIRAAAAIGRRIIEKIPRLGNVARMIGMMGDVDGSMQLSRIKTDDERIVAGAALLRTAIEWDFLVRQGLSSTAAVDEIRASLPLLPLPVATILLEQNTAEPNRQPVQCAVSDLQEGMVLYDDVLTSDGVILLRSGRRLTITIIEKLRGYQSSTTALRPIRIVDTDGAPEEELALV